MGKKVKLGLQEVDIDLVCRDTRGVEDMVVSAIENDWQENRYLQFDSRIFPFSDAADIAEWDNFLLDRYPPIYTNTDFSQEAYEIERERVGSKLDLDVYQAKLFAWRMCRGASGQIKATREMLNYVIKTQGKDKPVTWGEMGFDISDPSHLTMFTGLCVKTVDDLNRVQSYVEDQLNKCLTATFSSTDKRELERSGLHVSSMLLVSMNVAELLKTNFFNFIGSGDKEISEMIEWPPVSILGGLGAVEAGKPVITFIGDNCVPAWLSINLLKEKGLEDKIEVCGIGEAGHDIVRFYERCRIVTSTPKATKAIRTGFSDVIVANSSSMNIDIVSAAKRVDTRVIWTSTEGTTGGLLDWTDRLTDAIVNDLIAGAPGAWIRYPEKAAEVAIRVVQGVKRKGNYCMTEEEAKAEAKKVSKGDECDICFALSPYYSCKLSKAIKKVETDGLKALWEVERNCILSESCDEIGQEKIRVNDLLVAAYKQRAPEDKFKMRPGRGAMSRVETCAWAFSMMWGNCPGLFHILGCGDGDEEAAGDIANELVSRNCIVFVADNVVGDIARHYNEKMGKSIFEEFGGEANLRNMINHGASTGCVNGIDQAVKWPRTGAAISNYGAFSETCDIYTNVIAPVLIVWGPISERMEAVMTAWARTGTPVVVGPASALKGKTFLPGNKWDWEKWWVYDSITGEKRLVPPTPKHMLIPVETKEEILPMAQYLVFRTMTMRDARITQLEALMEYNKDSFGEWSDDWYMLATSAWELPLRYKAQMLKILKEKHGWEIKGLNALKGKHPDGRLIPIEQFSGEYGVVGGVYPTFLPRMFADPDIREYKTSYEIECKTKKKVMEEK